MSLQRWGPLLRGAFGNLGGGTSSSTSGTVPVLLCWMSAGQQRLQTSSGPVNPRVRGPATPGKGVGRGGGGGGGRSSASVRTTGTPHQQQERQTTGQARPSQGQSQGATTTSRKLAKPLAQDPALQYPSFADTIPYPHDYRTREVVEIQQHVNRLFDMRKQLVSAGESGNEMDKANRRWYTLSSQEVVFPNSMVIESVRYNAANGFYDVAVALLFEMVREGRAPLWKQQQKEQEEGDPKNSSITDTSIAPKGDERFFGLSERGDLGDACTTMLLHIKEVLPTLPVDVDPSSAGLPWKYRHPVKVSDTIDQLLSPLVDAMIALQLFSCPPAVAGHDGAAYTDSELSTLDLLCLAMQCSAASGELALIDKIAPFFAAIDRKRFPTDEVLCVVDGCIATVLGALWSSEVPKETLFEILSTMLSIDISSSGERTPTLMLEHSTKEGFCVTASYIEVLLVNAVGSDVNKSSENLEAAIGSAGPLLLLHAQQMAQYNAAAKADPSVVPLLGDEIFTAEEIRSVVNLKLNGLSTAGSSDGDGEVAAYLERDSVLAAGLAALVGHPTMAVELAEEDCQQNADLLGQQQAKQQERIDAGKSLLVSHRESIGPAAVTQWCRFVLKSWKNYVVIVGQGEDEEAAKKVRDLFSLLLIEGSRQWIGLTKLLQNQKYEQLVRAQLYPGQGIGSLALGVDDANGDAALVGLKSGINGALETAASLHEWDAILSLLELLERQQLYSYQIVHPDVFAEAFTQASSPLSGSFRTALFMRSARTKLYSYATVE